ncbi:NUDIX hydrolase domain-like protein [Apiospora arundinis]
MSDQPTQEAPHPRVGVAAIVRNEKGEVILGRRLGSHGSGSWALPGGHLEYGETYFACAERETLEETGLEVKALKLLTVTNDIFNDLGKHYITLFVMCERSDKLKEPQVLEQEKCESWHWIHWDELKSWVAHQQDTSGPFSDKKLFLPMIHLIQQVPEI